MIAAVVLAAGGSSRLGRPKQLVEFGGRSLLRNAVEAAVGGGCDPVVVILGAEAERIRPELEGLAVVAVTNPCWRHGVATSIRRGVAEVEQLCPEVEGVVLIACDQPLLSPAIIRALIEAHRDCSERAAAMVASAYAETLGTPALFGRDHFGSLGQLDGDRGARGLLRESAPRVVTVAWPQGAVDIDRPEDLEHSPGNPGSK